ncbi:MAG: LysM peptidoglycan-binding domain-containing protein [Verrucomicrobiota bacterium]
MHAVLLRSLLGISVALAFASCKSPTSTSSNDAYGAYGGQSGSDDFYQTGGSNSSGGEYDYVYDQGNNSGYDYSGDSSSYNYESSSGSSNSYSSYDNNSSSSGSSYSTPSNQYYTVQRGDTLYRISQNHGTTVAALQSANGISGTLIRPGDRLVIP